MSHGDKRSVQLWPLDCSCQLLAAMDLGMFSEGFVRVNCRYSSGCSWVAERHNTRFCSMIYCPLPILLFALEQVLVFLPPRTIGIQVCISFALCCRD